MQKYTENIDQLENFYSDVFNNAEIEPPAAMWDKVSNSYEKSLKKNKSKRGLYLFLAFLITSSVLGYFIYSEKNNSEQKINTKIIIPVPSEISKDTPDNITSQPIKETNKKSSIKKLSSTIIADSINHPTSNSVSEEPVNPNNTTDNVIPNKSEDTVSTILKEERKEKTKVKFKDKYKQQYQDSTRPLFVPHK